MKRMIENCSKGQVTVLVLLLGILGLTIGLSVVSRSLSDLKQASYVDFGTKALAAAETGVEYALNQIKQPNFAATFTTAAMCNPNLPPQQIYDASKGTGNNISIDASTGLSSLYYSACMDRTGYKLAKSVAKDQTAQVEIPSSSAWTSPLVVYWNNTADLEITQIIYDVTTQDYTTNRFAYVAYGATRTPTNNFSAGGAASTCAANATYCGVLTGFTSCATIPGVSVANNYLVQLRVKPVYTGSDIMVCGGSGSPAIPPQYWDIVSKATTTNGTVKRIRVQRDITGVMPSVFDNAIFSGGGIIK